VVGRYTLFNKWWVNVLCLAEAFSCGSFCLKLCYKLTQGEPFLQQVVIRSAAAVSALSLVGIFMVPRTVFDAHQTFVFGCCISSGVLMVSVSLLHPVTPAAIAPYLIGSWITQVHYNQSSLGFTFLIGEIMFIEAYIFFLMAALYPRVGTPENFSLIKWVAFSVAPVFIMWRVQEEFLEHTTRLQAQIYHGSTLG
jgi:hypothetical protein